jgi:hypothetical protein
VADGDRLLKVKLVGEKGQGHRRRAVSSSRRAAWALPMTAKIDGNDVMAFAREVLELLREK